MKHCKACHVNILTPDVLCPLCKGPLVAMEGAEIEAYPPTVVRRKYNFVKRLLLFLTVIMAILCVAVNLLVTNDFWWWPIALTVMVSTWIVVPHVMRHGGNAGGKALMCVFIATVAVLLIDFQTGWRGWSVSYVLPVILCGGIVCIVILILCNRTNWAGYVIYQFTLGIFGFVPLVLYFTHVSSSLVAAIIPAAFAVLTLAGLLLFGDRTIKNEFKRRLRF